MIKDSPYNSQSPLKLDHSTNNLQSTPHFQRSQQNQNEIPKQHQKYVDYKNRKDHVSEMSLPEIKDYFKNRKIEC